MTSGIGNYKKTVNEVDMRVQEGGHLFALGQHGLCDVTRAHQALFLAFTIQEKVTFKKGERNLEQEMFKF